MGIVGETKSGARMAGRVDGAVRGARLKLRRDRQSTERVALL